MKLKIFRADNVIIELDGTSDEVKAVIVDVLPSQMFTISYPQTTQSPVGTPYMGDSTFCFHEYPIPWHGITPPKCVKCGA